MSIEEQLAAMAAKIEALEAAHKAAASASGPEPKPQETEPQETNETDDEPPGWLKRWFGKKPDEPEDKAETKPDDQPEKNPPTQQPQQPPPTRDDDGLKQALGAIMGKLETLERRVGYVDTEARDKVLDDLDVDPDLRQFFPTFDPRTESGRLAAEKFLADNPKFAPHRRPAPVQVDMDKLPEIPHGPTKAEMAAAIAKVDGQDWRVKL